jgi:hypothetical protein
MGKRFSMTIDEYADIVFNFDDNSSEEEMAQKLNDLGIPEAEQVVLANEFLSLLAPGSSSTNVPGIVSSKLDAADTNKWLVHFSGRNTGTVVHANSRSGAISRARAKKVVGSDGKIDAARRCNDRELAMISKGTWIRTRANGKETGGAFKFRKWMKN